jgi:hypothetical protein
LQERGRVRGPGGRGCRPRAPRSLRTT